MSDFQALLIRDFLFCNRDGRDGESIMAEIFTVLGILGGDE